MGKVGVPRVLFYVLIILAVVGVIALIVFLMSVGSNGSIKVVIFGNNTNIFSNKTNVDYVECTVNSDCPQCGADNARCPTYFVCKNRVCVEKQYNNNELVSCTSDSDCSSGFSCWYKLASGMTGAAGIPGSKENPGKCYDNEKISLPSPSSNPNYECQTDSDCSIGKKCLVYACAGIACESNDTTCDTNCQPYSRCG